MAIALRAMRASGELTAAQALGRLRREAPAAVHTAACAVALTAVATIVAFGAGDEVGPYELLALMGLGLAVVTCATLGALVLAARPGHRLGLALLGGGALGSLWTLATVTVEAVDPGDPLGQWAAWLDNWTFVGLLVLVTWPLLLFPDGNLPSRRWRPVAGLLAVGLAGLALRGILDPGALDEIDGGVPNPLGIPADWSWINALGVFGFGIPLGVVAGMVAVQVRARRRREPAMRAALWASRGLAANFVLCLALNLTDSPLADGAFYAATLTTSISAFAATAAVAILRDRAVEVDLLLRRAFIVAGVAVGTLLVFLVAFALATSLAGSSESALGGGLAAALVVVPLRVRVRDRVDRALYGHRDPSTAVRRVGEQLELADEPAGALPGVAHALRETLGASGVRIEPNPVVALDPAAAGAELPRAAARAHGQLPRAAARAADRRSAGAGRALWPRRPRARRDPRAPARARTRRPAHGGGGPALARGHRHRPRGGAPPAAPRAARRARLRAGRHRAHAPGGPQCGRATRRRARGGRARADRGRGRRRQANRARAATADARGPRPRRRAARARRPAGAARGRARPPARAPRAARRRRARALPHRHRGADQRRPARPRAPLPSRAARNHDEAVLEIADDGPGLAPDATAGVGLRSMRERAAELGGRVELSSRGEVGLELRVRLPLARA